MARGPESNLWQRIKKQCPPRCHLTRIESSTGLGIPDVHIVWDGLAFWLELKVAKVNAVRVSPHQVAWNMADHARGGKSFYLVEQASSSDLYLFGGDRGAELMNQGLVCGGSRFEDLASLFKALRPLLL